MPKKLPELLDAHIGPDKLFVSNREFARAADVSEFTVRASRAGKTTPQLQTLRKFAKALEMPFMEFERRVGLLANANHPDEIDPLDALILRLLKKLAPAEKKLAIELLRHLGEE